MFNSADSSDNKSEIFDESCGEIHSPANNSGLGITSNQDKKFKREIASLRRRVLEYRSRVVGWTEQDLADAVGDSVLAVRSFLSGGF